MAQLQQWNLRRGNVLQSKTKPYSSVCTIEKIIIGYSLLCVWFDDVDYRDSVMVEVLVLPLSCLRPFVLPRNVSNLHTQINSNNDK